MARGRIQPIAKVGTKNPEAKLMWRIAKERAGVGGRLGGDVRKILLFLHRHRNPIHGRAIARFTNTSQSNTTAHTLPKLATLGFVDRMEAPEPLGHQGGGRPTILWQLNSEGRKLVRIL